MGFTPFIETDQPTMAAFNEKFQEAISEAISAGVKIETGSYVGTGTSGKNNANTIALNGDDPVVVIVTARYYSGLPGETGFGLLPQSGFWQHSFIWTFGCEKTNIVGGNYEVVFDASNRGVFKWYTENTGSSASKAQLNYLGVTYDYIVVYKGGET